MAVIYQLMIDGTQIGDVYHNENDAVDNAIQTAIDLKKSVAIGKAEENVGIPYNALEWSIVRVWWV